MKCPACGSTSSKPRFTATDRLYGATSAEFQVVSCAACGLLRLDPPPTPEELAQYYPPSYWFDPAEDTASRLAEAYRTLVLRDHVRFVERALRSSGETGPVLDVGCGGGLFLRMLAERGFAALGMDISPEAAGIAWKRQGVPAVCGLLERAPVRAGSCAAVTMFHVVEHLYDPHPYLAAARDLLRPRGRLIVQVPDADCWQFRLFGSRWNGIDVPRHLVDYRGRDLEKIFERCGFRVLRRKHFSLRDNPAGLASTVAPPLDPMARRVRRTPETATARMLKDLVYFGLVLASVPFAALEAAAGAGSTIMLEACRK